MVILCGEEETIITFKSFLLPQASSISSLLYKPPNVVIYSSCLVTYGSKHTWKKNKKRNEWGCN